MSGAAVAHRATGEHVLPHYREPPIARMSRLLDDAGFRPKELDINRPRVHYLRLAVCALAVKEFAQCIAYAAVTVGLELEALLLAVTAGEKRRSLGQFPLCRRIGIKRENLGPGNGAPI